VAAPSRPPLRRDAQRNHEAILSAARELFAQSSDVPMYEIARLAGVGQATLYRHFPDHGAIAAALFSEVLDRLEELAGQHADDPDAFFVVLRGIAEAQARFHGLGYFIRESSAVSSELEPLKLRDAKAAGTLRPDVTLDDVLLVFAMIEGVLSKASDHTRKATSATRALALILDGLTMRSIG
jgi:AcrR family transcriptional regulator